MHSGKSLSPKIVALFICLALLGNIMRPAMVKASGLLSLMSDTLSNPHISPATSNHTINFTTATTSATKQINFQFSTEIGGATKPADLDLSSATLSSTNNLGTGWSLITTSAASGLLKINRDSADNIDAATAGSVILAGITNSSYEACLSNTGTLTDTCYVNITTFSDDGVTAIDSGSTTYTVIEDPSLSFEVRSVASGTTHNGITTNLESTDTTLAFGKLGPDEVKYIAQELVISTNAPHGYKVYTYLTSNISGVYGTSLISPFGATDATWDTPQVWETPTGFTPNSNTGWIAANTSDTRVSGWGSASAKFGPVSQTPHLVATSTTADRSGSNIFITFALGVNSLQPSDTYSGKIIYDVQAIY